MGYTALYRKLRPNEFGGIVGQEHITSTLKNQITGKRVSHAYLFCGTRGTGKTSTAKVFAKAINCEKISETGEPCGNCPSCREIETGASVNVVEIDAASNNGVDNVREIREDVRYAPVTGYFKVYIIDEVHMLSAGAFNALLKTLEEPPAHVVFILATTDPQKIPPTIHSRCQRYDFHRISATTIAQTLQKYAKQENIDAEDTALRYIAVTADGAMRDALNILDQCVSFYFGEKITVAKAKEITGSVDDEALFVLTDALFEKNSLKCIELINGAVNNGRDIYQLTSELTVHLRNLLIAVCVPNAENTFNFSTENIEKINVSAKKYDLPSILLFINEFSRLLNNLKRSSNDRILLETTCLTLCNEIAPPKVVEKETLPPPAQIAPTPAKPPVKEKAIPEQYKQVLREWQKFCLGTNENVLKALLSRTKTGYIDTECIYIICGDVSTVSLLKKREKEIGENLTKKFGAEFNTNVIFEKNYSDAHKKRMGIADNFDYSFAEEVENIKNSLGAEITVE